MKEPKNNNNLGNNESRQDDFKHPECIGTENLNISSEVPNNYEELLEIQERNIFVRFESHNLSDVSKEILKIIAERRAGPKVDIEIASVLTKKLLNLYNGLIDKLNTYYDCKKEVIEGIKKDNDRLALAMQNLSLISIYSIEETFELDLNDEDEEELVENEYEIEEDDEIDEEVDEEEY